jgi:hypothetical protein
MRTGGRCTNRPRSIPRRTHASKSVLRPGIDDLEHELGRDVSRTQVNDTDEGRPRQEGGTAEGQVVGDDDTALTGCAFKNINIRTANQLLVPCGPYIAAARTKSCHDVGSDVLVRRQKRKVERLHARIFSSQVCSPLSASAA